MTHLIGGGYYSHIPKRNTLHTTGPAFRKQDKFSLKFQRSHRGITLNCNMDYQ